MKTKSLTILERFFPASTTVEIKRMPKLGASGPKVIIFSVDGNKQEMALKFGVSRIPITAQIVNREKLAPFFNHRLVPILNYSIDGEEENWAILMPAYEGNFHEAVTGCGQIFYNGEAPALWESIITDFTGLWSKSKEMWNDSCEKRLARRPKPRIETVAQAIKAYTLPGLSQNLSQYWHLPLTINGNDYPSLAETFEQISTAYLPPAIVVYCHGDPNANNIMLNRNGDWAMADWEWCGLHDWRLSASHFIGWWLSSSAIQEKKPTAEEVGSKLVLDYRFRLNRNVQDMVKFASAAFENFALSVNETQFHKQWKLMLAVLLLGEVRFLDIRKIPPDLATYLIGEAMTTWWD